MCSTNQEYLKIYLGALAQLVEQRTFNPFVVGSTPAGPTRIFTSGYEVKYLSFGFLVQLVERRILNP